MGAEAVVHRLIHRYCGQDCIYLTSNDLKGPTCGRSAERVFYSARFCGLKGRNLEGIWAWRSSASRRDSEVMSILPERHTREAPMKSGIHPEYKDITVTCTCG